MVTGTSMAHGKDAPAGGTELVINDYGIVRLHFQVVTWATRKGLTYTPRTGERTFAFEVAPAQQ